MEKLIKKCREQNVEEKEEGEEEDKKRREF